MMNIMSFFKKGNAKKRPNQIINDGINYREIHGQREYTCASETVEYWLDTLETNQEKLAFIDFLLNIIKDDLRSDYMASIIYCEDLKNIRNECVPFVLHYWDEHEIQHEIYCKNEIKKLNLETDCVIVYPLSFKKIRNSFKKLNYKDFETTNHRQKAFYFLGLDIAYVSKGNHSTFVGMGLKKGHIVAREVYDICELFPHVDTDGVNWINHHNQEILQRVPDFRFAILYELARMKSVLETTE